MFEKKVETATAYEILKVFRTLHRLKELPRQGFVYFGFKGDETDSIAEHSFMVTWIAHVIGLQLGLSPDELAKVTLMALIHDWGEAITGDVGYKVKAEDEERRRSGGGTGVTGQSLVDMVKVAFGALVRGLGLKQRQFLLGLWQEYNEEKSSRVAHTLVFYVCAPVLIDLCIVGLPVRCDRPRTIW